MTHFLDNYYRCVQIVTKEAHYLPHTIICFCLIDFQLYKDSSSEFTVKSPRVTQRSVSQENAL